MFRRTASRRNWTARCGGADVGLLYDPRRDGRGRACALAGKQRWRRRPALRVRRNYPYAGKGDGLTSHLAPALFHAARMSGIELEINQAIVYAAGALTSAGLCCVRCARLPHANRCAALRCDLLP